MYIHALVTIVLERAWAALKCDQLPVVNSDTSVLYLAIFVSKTESEYCYIHFLQFSIALSTLNKNFCAYEKRINKQLTD